MDDKPLPRPQPSRRGGAIGNAVAAVRKTWQDHKAVGLMLFAQLLSSLMAASAKVLQTTGPAGTPRLSASEILFAMMTIVTVLSWGYMWARSVPEAPLGPSSVRALLAVRGVAGFFGIWGYYYSLRFLPIAEATVINFLAPMLAAFAGAALLRTPFTSLQRLAGLVSIVGVVLVAKPWHIIWPHEMVCEGDAGYATMSAGPQDADPYANCTIEGRPVTQVPTPIEHALAIGVALVGVAGGAASFVAMAWIGKDAHPMVTVSYFATCVTVLTGISLLLVPADAFRVPVGGEWILLAFQGVCGFAMHVTITASMALERSSRALNMVYSQIIFAIAVDLLVWGTAPGPVSIGGGLLILSAVIAVAVTKPKPAEEEDEVENRRVNGEDVELMAGDHTVNEEDEETNATEGL